MVRKKGLEPSRPCGHQPIKLMRINIKPVFNNKYDVLARLKLDHNLTTDIH